MKYRQLADTGVFVSELCLGAMTFGGRGQQWDVIAGLEQGEVDAIVHRSLDAGVNFIDTADVYSRGESEALLGRSLQGRRHQVVLATKVRGRMGSGANDVGLSRLHIVQAIEDSLRRLGTDFVDLYQIHRFDSLTNLEDTLRALDDLVRAGKVRYIGCSNLAAWQMMKALAISREQNLERFRCTQSYYSLAGREIEREILPFITDQNLALLVWSPLAGGLLSGKFTRETGDDAARRASFDFPPVDKTRVYDIIDTLRAVADARGATPARVALAWVLAQPRVTSVIIGARRLDQLEDNLQAIDLTLTAEELQTLDGVSRLTPEYPGWMGAALSDDRLPGQERRFTTTRPRTSTTR
ncbi:MAG: aldo/keto reductase [Vicinamibacterales bacterium]